MKKIKTVLALIAAAFSVSSFAYYPQESGGGDLEALQFVKMGRLLLEEMKSEAGCSLGKTISLKRFSRNLERIEIETSKKEQISEHHYVLNRTAWFWLPLNEKAKKVLSVYSDPESEATIQFSNADIQRCMTSSNWSKIDGPDVYDKSVRHIEIEKEVRQISADLIAHLKNPKDTAFFRAFGYTHLAKLEATANKTLFTISPVPIRFMNNTLKDGVNTHGGPTQPKVLIDGPMWVILSRGQKMELLFHEYLGIMGIDDHRYRFSSRLFFLIDANQYSS